MSTEIAVVTPTVVKPVAVESPIDKLRRLTMTPESRAEGAWVRRSLIMDTEFSAVAAEWKNKCWTFGQAQQELANDSRQRHDYTVPLSSLIPKVDASGKFVFQVAEYGEFAPTHYAMSQIGGWLDRTGARAMGLLPARLAGITRAHTMGEGRDAGRLDDDSDNVIVRDDEDKALAVKIVQNGFRHMVPNRKVFIRTWDDGTMRSCQSETYNPINHREVLSLLAETVPGGLVSHWRGNADNLRCNILFPDTLLDDPQGGQYGAMLSVTNSEIGQLVFSGLPSIFASICRNGCIWGQKKGQIFKVTHRGSRDYDSLKEELSAWIAAQLPLAEGYTAQLLACKHYDGMGKDESFMPVLAQVAINDKLTRGQTGLLVKGYLAARAIEPATAKTLYGLVNAITRGGQGSPDNTLDFDSLGGRYMLAGQDGWQTLLRQARTLTVKQVEGVFEKIAV